MRYDTVVFDLDGTLLNTLQDLADAANYVCRAHGWPEHTLDEYRYFVGNGIPKLCQRFAPETARDEASQKEVLAQFSARYAAHKEDTTAPYPGIEAMLEALSAAGVRYGVLTNKEHTLAQGVMEHYFPGRFEFVQGAVPGVPTKPDPTALHHLLARMGADESRTLFVGDSDVDIHTAHNAGLPGAGVLWGFRTKEELTAAGAEALAATPCRPRPLHPGRSGGRTYPGPGGAGRGLRRRRVSGLLLESPVGPLWLTAQGGALTGCWFVNGRFPPELPPPAAPRSGRPGAGRGRAPGLKVYFSGRDPGPTPPLAAEGTPFQQPGVAAAGAGALGHGHQLWRAGRRPRGGKGHPEDERPGGGRRGGAQPHLPLPALPPGAGRRTAASPATAAGWRTRSIF